MKRSRLARIAVATLVLMTTLAGLASPAHAGFTTVLNGTFPYEGQGSHTRTFIEDVFEANIPDILAGAGKIRWASPSRRPPQPPSGPSAG